MDTTDGEDRMRSGATLSNELHDILAIGHLPDFMVPRDLMHDTLQYVLYTRKRMLELEDELETAKEDRKRDRRYHMETFGKMTKIMKQYACECKEECADKHEDPSFCGWAAKQAFEGKV